MNKWTVGGIKPINTFYPDKFNCVNDTLQFLSQEAGRARPKRVNYNDMMYYD